MTPRLRRAATGLMACSVACVAVLHVVRRDLEPAAHRLSEYANGPHAWLMTVAFVTLGLGLLALATGLVTPAIVRTPTRAVAAALVAVAGVGMLLSAGYPTRPGDPGTVELIHSAASALSTAALLTAAAVWSLLPAGRRRVRPADRAGTILAGLAGALGLVSPLLHDSARTGLSQRLLWAALVAWLLVTAWQPGQRRHAT